MPDFFSIQLTAEFAETAKAWEAARIVTTTIEHVNPGGGSFHDDWWELEAEGRRWSRSTLKEVEVLSAGIDLKDPTLYWVYSVPGLQWGITVYLWTDRAASLLVSAYAGEDRMQTEEAVRLVVKHAGERGVSLERGPTKVSSEEGQRIKGADLAINPKPMRKWRMFRAWVGPHLATYVVGTLTTFTSAALLIALGLQD